MLFSQSTYTTRRQQLRQLVGDGVLVLLGNNDSPMNYPANAYKFRQDSTFLYFTGQHRDGLALVIDCTTGKETLYGDEIDIDDIVWYGEVTSVKQMAEETGIADVKPFGALADVVKNAKKLHFLPPYRHDHQIYLSETLGVKAAELKGMASLALINAVVKLRNVKSAEEIAEMERAAHIGYLMHTKAQELATQPGMTEAYIAGVLEGIAHSYGSVVSFQSIVTMHGEILHGYPSFAPLEKGRLLLVDAGAETYEHYCSDHTRTTPISGEFTTQQKEIYDIVKDCHDLALTKAKPGVKYMDVHFDVCRLMTERLKALGLMKGDTEEAVRNGAHALFLPHGLGHAMGMDVHDMEGLGQIHVGFDEETRPNLEQFGTNALRFGKRLEVGNVVTDEPGIYFIPALIDEWQSKGVNADFLNFEAIQKYRDFGGVRIEDDVLITEDGCRFLGTERIPY